MNLHREAKRVEKDLSHLHKANREARSARDEWYQDMLGLFTDSILTQGKLYNKILNIVHGDANRRLLHAEIGRNIGLVSTSCQNLIEFEKKIHAMPRLPHEYAQMRAGKLRAITAAIKKTEQGLVGFKAAFPIGTLEDLPKLLIAISRALQDTLGVVELLVEEKNLS